MSTSYAPEPTADREREIGKFVRWLALAIGVLVSIPYLLGLIQSPANGFYLGYQYSVDDHMVYSAWMRQAMEGRFLFDNRFAIESQPGLTVHLYFLALGWLAKVVGTSLAGNLARVLFSVLFVFLFARLLLKLDFSIFTAKLALFLVCFGGGLGWLAWQQFGIALGPEHSPVLSNLLRGRASIDVWQPEAFVFPSMLVNGLFMVSLCLILWTLLAVLEAKDRWRPVLAGALAFGLLMNIHSYDVLLLALVLVGFLVTLLSAKQASGAWAARVAVIGLGAVPAAAWFLNVLQQDAVFQARAATPTFAANFAGVVFGLLPAWVLAGVALAKSDLPRPRQIGAAALLFGPALVLYVLSQGHDPNGYFLTWAGWMGWLVCTLAGLAVVARSSMGWNLFWAWGAIAVLAPYFPMLFQRKLGMGLMIPWAVIGAIGLARILKPLDRSPRNMVAALCLLVLCASSLRWFARERDLIGGNVAHTTVHRVLYSAEEKRVIDVLAQQPGRKVVVAMPGVPAALEGGGFASPYLPDLNPLFAGLAGAYAYAGHWSETPDYDQRRQQTLRFFIEMEPHEQRAFLAEIGATHVVAPAPSAFPELGLRELPQLGKALVQTDRYGLFEVAADAGSP